MQSIASAKLKLILFGEHAAVYGYPALGIPLPWEIKVTLAPSDKLIIRVDGLEKVHAEKLEELEQLLPSVFPELSQIPPCEISFQSNAPMGAGLGSSAALCTALTRSIYHLLEKYGLPCDKKITLQDHWLRAHSLEKVFHKTPSGIDTGISTHEMLSAFRGKEGKLPLYTPLKANSFWLVVGALPRNSDTATLVSGLRVKMQGDPSVRKRVEELGTIAASAISLFSDLRTADLKEIGKLATSANQILTSLDLSIPMLAKILEKGALLGALGGKLSGAGGGGAYFLVAEDRQHAIKLAAFLGDFSQKNAIPHCLLPTPIVYPLQNQ